MKLTRGLDKNRRAHRLPSQYSARGKSVPARARQAPFDRRCLSVIDARVCAFTGSEHAWATRRLGCRFCSTTRLLTADNVPADCGTTVIDTRGRQPRRSNGVARRLHGLGHQKTGARARARIETTWRRSATRTSRTARSASTRCARTLECTSAERRERTPRPIVEQVYTTSRKVWDAAEWSRPKPTGLTARELAPRTKGKTFGSMRSTRFAIQCESSRGETEIGERLVGPSHEMRRQLSDLFLRQFRASRAARSPPALRTFCAVQLQPSCLATPAARR